MEETVITKRIDIKPYKSMYEYRQANRLEEHGVSFLYENEHLSFLSKVVNGECAACDSKIVGKRREYTPDFYFPKVDIFVETKGKFTSEARTKFLEIVEQTSWDLRIVFMTDNYLTKKHGMRYSRWCELNNIKYAIGDIPLSWVEESSENDSINSS